jgi:hypothetical protein
MSLETFTAMNGIAINEDMHKEAKDNSDPEYLKWVDIVWKVAAKHIDKWINFSSFT